MLANCGPVLYDLAAYSGLRRAELCGLRWSDIDPDGAGIQIRQTIIELSRGQARPVELTCPDLRPGPCRAALQTAEVSEGPTMGAACAPRAGSADRPSSGPSSGAGRVRWRLP